MLTRPASPNASSRYSDCRRREKRVERNDRLVGQTRYDSRARFFRQWWKSIEEWRSRDCLWFDNDSEIIKPQYVVQKLAEITNNSAIITSDVGQHQMFAAQYYPFERPRQWLNSGGLGTMGVGLPYAMGAKLAAPDQDVFCITGEGSIQMNIQELSTCFQYRIPVNVVTLNNGYLGMVRQWQELYYGNRESETYFDSLPDFVKLAEAYGHIGIRVDKKSDVEGALLEAVRQKDRLVFMDFLTDKKQNVLPMVGNGKRFGRNGPAAAYARKPESVRRTTMRHILSVLMENESGAMSRVVGLFSARDYNIDSLAVAPTEDKTLSRMTIVTHGDEQVIEQITKQLNKLIEVIKVVDLNESRFVERELMLVKVRAVGKDRDEFLRLTEIYRGSIIDVTDRSYTIEITGSTDKLDSFLETVGRAQILETVRTGAAGIGRGERILKI